MQVRVRGLGSHARHATPRRGAAPPRRGAGDGDGLLADGRTPVRRESSPLRPRHQSDQAPRGRPNGFS